MVHSLLSISRRCSSVFESQLSTVSIIALGGDCSLAKPESTALMVGVGGRGRCVRGWRWVGSGVCWGVLNWGLVVWGGFVTFGGCCAARRTAGPGLAGWAG